MSLSGPQWLTIEGYDNKERMGLPVSFEAMFNPESVTVKLQNNYSTCSSVNQENETNFKNQGNSQVSFKLILSKTGVEQTMAANARAIGTSLPGTSMLIPDIASEVERFLGVTMRRYTGSHRPLYLILRWGTTLIDPSTKTEVLNQLKTPLILKGNEKHAYPCVLESVNINYTLFDRSGNPLRAELDTVFIEDPINKPEGGGLQSPDVTHVRTVNAGDSLPLMTAEVYDEPSYYIQVADANKLDSVRNLQPGEILIFPPIAQ